MSLLWVPRGHVALASAVLEGTLIECGSNNGFVCTDYLAINVFVQYDSGALPDIILLTQCYYHRKTRLHAIRRFCLCSL